MKWPDYCIVAGSGFMVAGIAKLAHAPLWLILFTSCVTIAGVAYAVFDIPTKLRRRRISHDL